MNPVLESDLWVDADRFFADGQQAYINFGQALSVLNDRGVTQQEIGKRYQLSQGAIAAAIAVGTDKRIIASSNNLPKSTKSLYLLTTLNDEDFEKLAKPETTQADIVKVKSPKAPASPSDKRRDAADRCIELKAEVNKYVTLCREHEDKIEKLEWDIDSLKEDNSYLRHRNAALEAEVAALKDALKAADEMMKAADVVVKTATEIATQKPVKTAKAKPVKDKVIKPVKSKPEKPVVDNADRQATLLELYALYKAMRLSVGDSADELKPFDVWIKTSFLDYLGSTITSRTGFQFLSDAKKLEVLTDTEFAEHVDYVRGVYES